jgi:hypothetical protein
MCKDVAEVVSMISDKDKHNSKQSEVWQRKAPRSSRRRMHRANSAKIRARRTRSLSLFPVLCISLSSLSLSPSRIRAVFQHQQCCSTMLPSRGSRR